MTDYFLLDNATGSIQAGPDQQDRLDELTKRLADGEFHVAAMAAVPYACIDGRPGGVTGAPNTAGGTESLMVADDLTQRRFGGGDTVDAYDRLLNELMHAGVPVGGHADDHAGGPKSGCGANDRLADIYAFIGDHGNVLRTLAEALGVTVRDMVHELIVRRARGRTRFSDGGDLLRILRTKAGNGAAPVLSGEHKEVIAVINMVRGTTLDRTALRDAFGPDYQAFNVDAWSFEDAAMALSSDGTGIPARIAALTYYNLATAHVLCGPNMRVIVRQ